MKKIIIFIIASVFFISNAHISYAAYNPADYQVGVDYHMTGSVTSTDAFLGQYQNPDIRSKVISQVQQMADSGVKVISTRIWLDGTGDFPTALRRHFPLTNQELQNIRQYAIDVSSIKGKDGKYLDLYYSILWLGCAKWWDTQPICSKTWDQYWTPYLVPNAKKTFTDFFSTIGNLTRPDGKKAVQLVYADGEIIIGNWNSGVPIKQNTDKFLTDVYPSFVAEANKYGISPSLYFIIQGPESLILDGQNPPTKLPPAIANHPSLDYIYPTTEFMKAHNLFIPKRLDMSIYVDSSSQSYATLINRVFSDLRTVYPNNDFAAAETYYNPHGQTTRAELGQAFANQFILTGEPKEVSFWQESAPPFDIASYLPVSNQTGKSTGYLDESSCSVIRGWAGDLNSPNSQIDVNLYQNGPKNEGGKLLQTIPANLKREKAVCDSLKSTETSCNHGFSIQTPAVLKDGKAHTVYAYGVTNINGKLTEELLPNLKPGSFTCSNTNNKAADLNFDGRIDINDYDILIGSYGKSVSGTPGDINGDGIVDALDYNLLVTNYGK